MSALEIEEVLRTHALVAEIAVVGKKDPQWGERVCAAVVLKEGAATTRDELRKWGKEMLAPYKVPSMVIFVNDLPRNPMGKVVKATVRNLFQE
ncbi:conserved hypothetical protein [delta proteobacterium NaphS2]|nr:conserved hypothetical protein [delta proteobacterium NaphS2]